MTVFEAMKKGLTKIRLPFWNDHAFLLLNKLDDGRYGPWVELHDPASTKEINKLPVMFLTEHTYEEFIEPPPNLSDLLSQEFVQINFRIYRHRFREIILQARGPAVDLPENAYFRLIYNNVQCDYSRDEELKCMEAIKTAIPLVELDDPPIPYP